MNRFPSKRSELLDQIEGEQGKAGSRGTETLVDELVHILEHLPDAPEVVTRLPVADEALDREGVDQSLLHQRLVEGALRGRSRSDQEPRAEQRVPSRGLQQFVHQPIERLLGQEPAQQILLAALLGRGVVVRPVQPGHRPSRTAQSSCRLNAWTTLKRSIRNLLRFMQ
ncbi:MAG: hypothetical protein L0H93_14745 [Nocardioides sp.]|nr:hypothetical protein [Nocardioides sp.]